MSPEPIEGFASFYTLLALMRRRLEDDTPLLPDERKVLIEMLVDYEALMTKSRTAMIKCRELGIDL